MIFFRRLFKFREQILIALVLGAITYLALSARGQDEDRIWQGLDLPIEPGVVYSELLDRPVVKRPSPTVKAPQVYEVVKLPHRPAEIVKVKTPPIPLAPPPIAHTPTVKIQVYGKEVQVPDRIVFVLDISDSMGWFVKDYPGLDGQTLNGNRLAKAKVELIRSIRALPESGKVFFNLISFDCAVQVCWPGEGMPANASSKADAERWVNNLGLGGATGTWSAMSQAFWLSPKAETIVLVTDGAPNCGSDIPTHRARIREANQNTSRMRGGKLAKVEVIAIGADVQEYKDFVNGVASDSGGSLTHVPH